jgi:hypothetical protein
VSRAGGEAVALELRPAPGAKCRRCWKVKPEAAAHAHGICARTIKDRCWYICVMENMVCLTQQPRGAQRQIVGAIRKQGDFNDTVALLGKQAGGFGVKN